MAGPVASRGGAPDRQRPACRLGPDASLAWPKAVTFSDISV